MEGKKPIGSSSPPKKGCIHTNSFFNHDLRRIFMKFVSLLASQNRIRPKAPVHFPPLLLPVGICHHSVGCLWSIGRMKFLILGSWWSSFTNINDGSCRTWTHSQPWIKVNVFFSKKITSSNILGEWNYPRKMWFHQTTPRGSKLSIHQPPQHTPSWCACSDTFQVFQHIDRLWKRASFFKEQWWQHIYYPSQGNLPTWKEI